MKRKEQWPELMTAYLEKMRSEEFSYGHLDCCLFAAGAVEAMTGEDPAAQYRGKYSNPAGALTVLKSIAATGGIPAMMDAMAGKYGWEKIETNRLAQRGDIALLRPGLTNDERFGGALGVNIGTLTIFMRDGRMAGVSTIETPGQPVDIVALWRIPII